MNLPLVVPQEYVERMSATANVALLGAPGAMYNEPRGIRELAPEGVERANVMADLMYAVPDGNLILHPGYGGGYKKGGPEPTSYIETEAYAYKGTIADRLRSRYEISITDTGWEVLPRELSGDSFDPEDFSSSTAKEAFLINRTFLRLGAEGVLGLVGGPLQLQRLADVAEAMQLPIANRMVGITTSGINEVKLRERLVRRIYQRAILGGEQTPQAVLAREQAFFRSGAAGKLGATILGPLPAKSTSPSYE